MRQVRGVRDRPSFDALRCPHAQRELLEQRDLSWRRVEGGLWVKQRGRAIVGVTQLSLRVHEVIQVCAGDAGRLALQGEELRK